MNPAEYAHPYQYYNIFIHTASAFLRRNAPEWRYGTFFQLFKNNLR